MDDELFKMSGPIPAGFDAEKADNLEDVSYAIPIRALHVSLIHVGVIGIVD